MLPPLLHIFCITKMERKDFRHDFFLFFINKYFFSKKKNQKAVAVMLSARVSEEMELDALVIRRV